MYKFKVKSASFCFSTAYNSIIYTYPILKQFNAKIEDGNIYIYINDIKDIMKLIDGVHEPWDTNRIIMSKDEITIYDDYVE